MSVRARLASLRRGSHAEKAARNYLQTAGLQFVCANYRKRGGEIDLIFSERDVLVFVEVRYRRSASFVHPAETVDRHKQRKLLHCAEHYLQQYGNDFNGSRFDVVAITGDGHDQQVDWIRNAFEA